MKALCYIYVDKHNSICFINKTLQDYIKDSVAYFEQQQTASSAV